MFTRIPEILEVFNHPSAALREAAKHQVDSFDPNHPYWKVNSTVLNMNMLK